MRHRQGLAMGRGRRMGERKGERERGREKGGERKGREGGGSGQESDNTRVTHWHQKKHCSNENSNSNNSNSNENHEEKQKNSPQLRMHKTQRLIPVKSSTHTLTKVGAVDAE